MVLKTSDVGSPDQYRQIFEDNHVPMYVRAKESLDLLDVNQAACDFYGYTRSEFLALAPLDLYPQSAHTDMWRYFDSVENMERQSFDTAHKLANGTTLDVHVGVTWISWDGLPASFVVVEDISARTAALKQAVDSNEALKRAQKIGRVGDWSVDLRTGERTWSDELFRILGMPSDDGIPAGHSAYATLFTSEDLLNMRQSEHDANEECPAQGADHQIMQPDGTKIWVHQEIIAEYDDRGIPVRLLGTLHDVTDRKEIEMRLAEQARIDALTGLPNRKAAMEALTVSIASAIRSGSACAVFFIDVDHFKDINDTLGHTAGDELLKEVSSRLSACLRASDFVGRMGGDEFVVILCDIKDPARVATVAQNIKQVLAKPITHGYGVPVSVSIGIALYPQDGTTVEALIMNADTAMYHSKRGGRATHRFFSKEMHALAENKLRLDNELRTAVEDEAFVLLFQPILSSSGRPVGAESLLRLPQSDGTMLRPAQFMSQIQENGLAPALGKWTIATACRQAYEWNKSASPGVRVNLRVSSTYLRMPQFTETVLAALSESGLRPDLLELEFALAGLTHSAEQGLNALRELRRAGVRIAVLDCGTGYNSLALMRQVEFDTLKLDQTSLEAPLQPGIDVIIAGAVLSSAQSLGVTTLASGVTSRDQSVQLRSLGFNEQQGYPICEPMTPHGLGCLLSPLMGGVAA